MRQTESERVDDLPLIIHWLKQMQIEELIDQELPAPHGNRQGLSYGQLSVLLLTYIITQADHRLCAVEPWVNQHHRILETATGWKIGSKDATDDRLADLLTILGSEQHEAIQNMETYLGQHLIRAYELPTDKARSDTTSLSVYHQPQEEKTPEGPPEKKAILHKGHSKDHRPDLLQYRQMLATLDPVGMPLIGATLAGNGADDPLYFPTWKRLAQLIGHLDFLFLADCKASSWSNRAQIDREGGIYCFPLAMTGPRPKLLFDWVSSPPTTVTEILAAEGKPSDSPVGQGFSIPLGSLWFEKESQKWHCWSERWLVVQSYALAHRQIKGLNQRLFKAEKALAKLAAKPGKDPVVLQTKVVEILQRYRVTKYIIWEVKKKINYLKVYEGPGRSGGERPFRRVRQTRNLLTYQRCPEAIAEFKGVAGWRLYVTNATVERLSLEEAVFSYREQWQPERGFHRFKRGSLPALPIYFQDQQRICGLMFLLTIALRVFTLMEFVVRRQLTREQKSLAGLYEGNPKRTTTRPTAEKLLVAFRGITFYFHRDGSTEITPLDSLQRQILALMKIPESIYIVPSLDSGGTHTNRSILCGH
jgi:transposase